jgi:hypothetical protein
MNETTNAWETRVTSAAQALGFTYEDLNVRLRTSMGVTTTEMLDDDDLFKFGDFREEFKDKPIVALRSAFRALRGGKKETTQLTGGGELDERTKQLHALGFKVKLDDADTCHLLQLYLPDKPADPVTNALKKRFGTKAVIAFNDDGKVAVAETMEYVAGLEQGYPETENIMVNGKLTKLWAVGVKPDVMVEEDPLFPGVPLRNGCSTVNHRNWTKVEARSRQLCRIILERGDINPENKDASLRLMERAQQGYAALGEAYPEAELAFRDRAAKDDLPKLKVPLGSSSQKQQNPFGVRRQY